MATSTKRRVGNGTENKGAKSDIDWQELLVEAMEVPGALGNTYNRFYNYSFCNQVLLMMQGVVEPVATYRRWLELGCQVQKGSKAKVVLAPILVNREVTTNGVPVLGPDGKPTKRQVLIGFRDSRTVFGYSDTDGNELPDIELPAWDVDTALRELNVSREKFADTDGNTQGYSIEDRKGRRLAINPTAKYPAKTLLHELAHLVIGHCRDLAEGKQTDHRGICEFEAEATAYLAAKELELIDWDASESREYIQWWLQNSGGEEVTDRNISRVFAAVNKILTAGRKAESKAA